MNKQNAKIHTYRLEVSNFGPIVEANVEMRPLTVFVGPSNTGKSYLAILLYVLHRALQGSRERLGGHIFTGGTFFADPYSSWQRSTNEWLNRRLRRYFPKGTSLADVTDADLNKTLAKINRCPMKVLGWKTPYEAYYGVERKLTRNCV